MKKSSLTVFLAALYVFLIPVPSHAIPVGEGDTFRFGIDLSSAIPAGPYDYLAWYVSTTSADGFDPGDIMSVALFDDTDPTTTLGTGTFDWTSGWFTTLGVGAMMASNPAFDGTGYLLFTMESGSIDLADGAVYGINGGYTISGLTDISILPTTPIPEPDTLLLLGLALLILGFMSYFTTRKSQYPFRNSESVA